jgi:predicted acetyltransferase
MLGDGVAWGVTRILLHGQPRDVAAAIEQPVGFDENDGNIRSSVPAVRRSARTVPERSGDAGMVSEDQRQEMVELRLPRTDEEQEFLSAHRATSPGVPSFLHYYAEGMPFDRYLEVLQQQARGEHLSPQHVPSTFLFAFDGPRIVGRVSIRHGLNEFLLRLGGHIGYVVVPEFRRRGYATAMLRRAIEIARDRFGLTRVLLTCDDDNVGSIRTIEKNGGVLENIVTGPDLATPKRRYWIDARQRDA